jgi:pimeloyl-ACP methyl ester carboxylesterase
VLKMLPALTNPQDGVSFHVVAPSLPNFGFSQAVNKPGFGLQQYAAALHGLMSQLGYRKYAAQGGDWGQILTRVLGLLYTDNILACHTNMVWSSAPTFFSHPWLWLKSWWPLSDADKAGLGRAAWYGSRGNGYYVVQKSKPNTLGFGLADSPVAVLAWIYEKLHDWTDGYPFSDDEILTWTSLYLFSTAGADASVRIYYESKGALEPVAQRARQWNGKLKMGLSIFPKDIMVAPPTWRQTLGPIVFERTHSRGGHFAAYEMPDELAKDLRDMFSRDGELGRDWAKSMRG